MMINPTGSASGGGSDQGPSHLPPGSASGTGGGNSPMGGVPPPPATSVNRPSSNTAGQTFTTGTSGSASGSANKKTTRPVDPDRLFLFMIIDYLKRRGMTASVNSVLAEARVDPMSPETAETVQLMDLLNQMHGRNPQPAASAASEAGFLRDWWGAFWQMYQTKLNGSRRMQSTGMASPVMQTQPQAHTPLSLPSQQQQQQQPPASAEFQRRAIIMTAMQSVGLAGRDPSTLTPEEQRLVTMAIQQLQAQQFQRLQWPGRSEESASGSSGGSSGGSGKKKKTDPGPSTSAQQSAPAAAPSAMAGSSRLTPQQMLHMRAAQIQQQQQQQQRMMMMAAAATSGTVPGSPASVSPTAYPMGTGATFPVGASRVIMPGPGGVPIPMTRPSAGSGTNRPKKGGTAGGGSADIRPIRASPQPPEMDESALLSFFGTPQDWFAASPMTTASPGVTDQFGNIPVASISPSPSATAAPGEKTSLPLGTAPDALGLTSNTTSSSSVGSSPSVALESPHPEVARPTPFSAGSASVGGVDANDLLLVTGVNDDEAHQAGIKATESGLFLGAIASLGQHTPGSKAVSASFSQDGLLMASGGHDKRIILYHVPSRGQLTVLEGQHTQQITQVRFAPSGERRLLASSSFDKTIMVWDLGGEGEDPLRSDGVSSIVSGGTPKLILRDVHEEPIWSIDFVSPVSVSGNDLAEDSAMESLSGLRLCSIDAAGKMVIWDSETGVALHTTMVRPRDDRAVTVRQVRGRPNKAGEAAILAIAHGSNVEFFDCDRYEFVGSLPVSSDRTSLSGGGGGGAAKSIVAINWGDASSAWHLITVTSDCVSIWDVAPLMGGGPATLLASHQVLADKITCCSLLMIDNLTDEGTGEAGKRLAIFGGYQSIYLWEWEGSLIGTSPHGSPNPEQRLRVVKFPTHEGLVVSLPVTRAGPLLIGSVSHDGWAKLWQIDYVQPEVLPEDSLGGRRNDFDQSEVAMLEVPRMAQHESKTNGHLTASSGAVD